MLFLNPALYKINVPCLAPNGLDVIFLTQQVMGPDHAKTAVQGVQIVTKVVVSLSFV